MSESRPSNELIAAGDLPPCLIDEQGSTPVFGSGCEGVTDLAGGRRFDHAGCPGWWRDASATTDEAPGFRCSCPCHFDGNGWPGWDGHLTGPTDAP